MKSKFILCQELHQNVINALDAHWALQREALERADCLEWNYHLEILSEAWLQLGFKGPLQKKTSSEENLFVWLI